MADFNITIARPPGCIFASAFLDVAVYLKFHFERLGHSAAVTENLIDPQRRNIVFGLHMFATVDTELPADTVIFNTEPLPLSASWWPEIRASYPRLLRRFVVWDYSSHNAKRSAGLRAFVIPLAGCRGLQRAAPSTDRHGCLFFYGMLTARRNMILAAISAAGLPLRVLDQADFGTGRDQAIAGAVAVLNIHKENEPNLFEPVRCFYPLNNGVPVISETFAPDPAYTHFEKALFIAEAADLPQFIRGLLSDAPAFQAQARHRLNRFTAVDPLTAIHHVIERTYAR